MAEDDVNTQWWRCTGKVGISGKGRDGTFTGTPQILTQRGQVAVNVGNAVTQRKEYSGQSNLKQLILAWGENKEAMSTCWLCGMKVPLTQTIAKKLKVPVGISPPSSQLGYPEAEHVLFLKVGYLFLSIPGEKFIGKIAPWVPSTRPSQLWPLNKVPDGWGWDASTWNKWVQEMRSDYNIQIKLEMQQSHLLCNQLKNQFNFIRFNGGPSGKWEKKGRLLDIYKNKIMGRLEAAEASPLPPPWTLLTETLDNLVEYLNGEHEKTAKPHIFESITDFPEYAQETLNTNVREYNTALFPFKYIITRCATKFVKTTCTVADMKEILGFAINRFLPERSPASKKVEDDQESQVIIDDDFGDTCDDKAIPIAQPLPGAGGLKTGRAQSVESSPQQPKQHQDSDSDSEEPIDLPHLDPFFIWSNNKPLSASNMVKAYIAESPAAGPAGPAAVPQGGGAQKKLRMGESVGFTSTDVRAARILVGMAKGNQVRLIPSSVDDLNAGPPPNEGG